MDQDVALLVMLAGCGTAVEEMAPAAPYATTVVAFTPGEGAGFGQERLPAVVTGPPDASGAPSLDVLSLGAGGEIVLEFDVAIVDGEGPDFVVFENPFYVNGDPRDPYAEPAEVSVSADGVTFETFACAADGEEGRYPGCAGWTPTFPFDPKVDLIEPSRSGGDAFDLADVGLGSAQRVRIRDLTGLGEAPSRGFDLDAVGLVHYDTSR